MLVIIAGPFEEQFVAEPPKIPKGVQYVPAFATTSQLTTSGLKRSANRAQSSIWTYPLHHKTYGMQSLHCFALWKVFNTLTKKVPAVFQWKLSAGNFQPTKLNSDLQNRPRRRMNFFDGNDANLVSLWIPKNVPTYEQCSLNKLLARRIWWFLPNIPFYLWKPPLVCQNKTQFEFCRTE